MKKLICFLLISLISFECFANAAVIAAAANNRRRQEGAHRREYHVDSNISPKHQDVFKKDTDGNFRVYTFNYYAYDCGINSHMDFNNRIKNLPYEIVNVRPATEKEIRDYKTTETFCLVFAIILIFTVAMIPFTLFYETVKESAEIRRVKEEAKKNGKEVNLQYVF